MATTPRSASARMSLPTPCARRTAAIGTLIAENPEPPDASTAAERAAASGSSGRGNGKPVDHHQLAGVARNIDALPQRHHPEQAAVAVFAELAHQNRQRLVALQQHGELGLVPHQLGGLLGRAARGEQPEGAPAERFDKGQQLLPGRVAQPGRGRPRQVRRHVEDALLAIVERRTARRGCGSRPARRAPWRWTRTCRRAPAWPRLPPPCGRRRASR